MSDIKSLLRSAHGPPHQEKYFPEADAKQARPALSALSTSTAFDPDVPREFGACGLRESSLGEAVVYRARRSIDQKS